MSLRRMHCSKSYKTCDLEIESSEIWFNAAIGAATRNYLQRVVKAGNILCSPFIPTGDESHGSE
jgi:hypothetical protein